MNLKKWLRRIVVIAVVFLVLGVAYRTVAAQRNLLRSSQLEVAEETYPAYTDRGYERLRLGDLTGAVADFDQAEMLHSSQCININIGRGLANLRDGDFEAAVSEFDQAQSLDPNSFDVYFYRGLAHLRNGEYDKAIVDYDEAIALDAGADSYFNRGTAFLLSGQVERGFMDYIQGVRAKGRPVEVEAGAQDQ